MSSHASEDSLQTKPSIKCLKGTVKGSLKAKLCQIMIMNTTEYLSFERRYFHDRKS